MKDVFKSPMKIQFHTFQHMFERCKIIEFKLCKDNLEHPFANIMKLHEIVKLSVDLAKSHN